MDEDKTRPHHPDHLVPRTELDEGASRPGTLRDKLGGIFWAVLGIVLFLLGRGGRGSIRRILGVGCSAVGCLVVLAFVVALVYFGALRR